MRIAKASVLLLSLVYTGTALAIDGDPITIKQFVELLFSLLP